VKTRHEDTLDVTTEDVMRPGVLALFPPVGSPLIKKPGYSRRNGIIAFHRLYADPVFLFQIENSWVVCEIHPVLICQNSYFVLPCFSEEVRKRDKMIHIGILHH
jgi:hypothetical protein